MKYRMEFKPRRQLRSNVVKNALKAYVVGPLTSKKQVFGLRCHCVDSLSKEKIWITRRLLESLLEENPYAVWFFWKAEPTWITKHGKKRRQTNKDRSNSEDKTAAEQFFSPGISLWNVFNLPESGLAVFEEYIFKEILAASLI